MNKLIILLLLFTKTSLDAEPGFFAADDSSIPAKVQAAKSKVFRLFVYLNHPKRITESQYEKAIKEIDPVGQKIWQEFQLKYTEKVKGYKFIPIEGSCSIFFLAVAQKQALAYTAKHCLGDEYQAILEKLNLKRDASPEEKKSFLAQPKSLPLKIRIFDHRNEEVFNSIDIVANNSQTARIRAIGMKSAMSVLFPTYANFDDSLFDLDTFRITKIADIKHLHLQHLEDFAVLNLYGVGEKLQNAAISWGNALVDKKIFTVGYPGVLSPKNQRANGLTPTGEKLLIGKGHHVLGQEMLDWHKLILSRVFTNQAISSENQDKTYLTYSEGIETLSNADSSLGMSGGPMLNSEGEVIALLTSGPSEKMTKQLVPAPYLSGGIPLIRISEAIKIFDEK